MRSDLLTLVASLAAREERFALVTVVRREPPSSARVGDTAVVTENGNYYGWVGGGCTRSTVLREALRAIAAGEPTLLSLSLDPGSGARPGIVALPMTCDSGGTVEIYVEPVLPVPRLLLFGNSAVVQVLARLGHAMGYRVEVIDADADAAIFPEAERLVSKMTADAVPRAAHVLVATMSERDLDVIEAIVPSAPAYLGVIASPKRFAQLRETLLARGISRSALERIAAPAGLDIGARMPEEIALSIMAQIVERRRRPGPELSQEDAAAAAVPSRESRREAIDPVCGMTVATAGSRHHAEAKGRTYHFCSAGCRTQFLSDSERYVSSSAEDGGS